MPTRNVVLTERQEALIEALVQSGRFQNANEVLREGLRLVENREADEAAKLDVLRAAVDLGLAAIDRGDVKTFPSASALVDYLNQVGAKARAAVPERPRSFGPHLDPEQRLAEMRAVSRRVAKLPDRDTRPADEIIGYDENGLPN